MYYDIPNRLQSVSLQFFILHSAIRCHLRKFRTMLWLSTCNFKCSHKTWTVTTATYKKVTLEMRNDCATNTTIHSPSMLCFHINSHVGTSRATFLCKVHQLCFKAMSFHVKILQVLQIMKKSFSYINEKPAYTDCILYLTKNSFSQKQSKTGRAKRIRVDPQFELCVTTKEITTLLKYWFVQIISFSNYFSYTN